MINDKVNILIVEDEGIVALALEDTLQTKGYQVAGTADNGIEALDIMKKNMVDLALLDIQIKGTWDGVETARQLTNFKRIPFIYLTAFSDEETVRKAKGTSPSAYLVKPYHPPNLLVAIDLALHNFAFQKNKPTLSHKVLPDGTSPFQQPKEDFLIFNNALCIKQKYNFIKSDFAEVQYIETSGNYSLVFIPGKKYVIRCSLNQILEKLKDDNEFLIRIHRSFAVNLQRLVSFNRESVLIDDKEIPLGRRYKEAFFKQFKAL